MNAGQRANRSGRSAEDVLSTILLANGLLFRRQVVVGRSIYDHKLRADFLVEPTGRFPDGLVIECKWQDASGSVDEKFPYVVENVRINAYGRPVVVVVGGGKAKPGAIRWLAMQTLSEARLIGVFSVEEFMTWLARK